MKNIILIMCMLCALTVFTQVVDDFSDGELLNNPGWQGDLDLFRVNEDLQLQLDAEGAGSAFLTTALNSYEKMEWRFWLRLKFSPSGNNNARLYLFAEGQDLHEPLYGYYLQLGEPGSADAISLFRQDGDAAELVCRGSEGLIASSFIISIRVIYSDGVWSIYSDPDGGDDYQHEADGYHGWQPMDGFLGLYCKFTSSNSKKIYFDDVYAGSLIIDNTAPALVNIEAEKHHLTLTFSETLDRGSAENRHHYRLNHGLGLPDSALQDPEDPSVVHLILENGLVNGTYYTLDINNICDLAGNCLTDTSLVFAYFMPRPFDIVINEIMADPSPSVQLPEHEYIELFNLTEFPVSLEQWTLTVGSSEKLLEGAKLGPGDYLILCRENAAFELSFWGPVHALGSLGLTNTGQSITLCNEKGGLISHAEYDKSWYGDEDKAEGGWSLELINPYNPCAGEGNWKASVHMEGGTPGASNANYELFYLPPAVEKACPVNDSTFELYFSQVMDTSALGDPGSYNLKPGPAKVLNARFESGLPEKVTITLSVALQEGTVYTLELASALQNCVGWPLETEEAIALGIPEKADYNDLVINEILFNPLAGGEDYVEVYNRSNKIIDLSCISLISIKSNFPNPDDTVVKPVAASCHLMFPGDYILLCKDAGPVMDYYYSAEPGAFHTMSSFPSYNNDEGRAALVNAGKELVDHFQYHEDMHHPLLNSVDGVSLERVHYNRRTEDPDNWHSASAAAGFGTPGYRNSQFLPENEHNAHVYLDPRVFFPGDYSRDACNLGIYYRFERAGNAASVRIFNIRGHLVRELVQNEVLGAQGVFIWNGMDERSLIASPGIYIVVVEVFNIHGNVRKFKKAAVVGQR